MSLDYKVATNRLEGTATLTVVPVQELDELSLDLHGLHVSSVSVDGRRPQRSGQRGDCLTVRPVAPLPPDRPVTVVVRYSGKPRPVRGPHGTAGWEELTDGVLVGSQPYGAPSWFPCNDWAADKATYRVAVTVAAAYHVAGNGELVSRRRRGASTTWVYEQREPMAPYLASVQIGPAEVEHRAASVPVEIVHPRGLAVGPGTAFAEQVAMLELYERLFGPYPFSTYRVGITDDPLEIPLEAQGFASFGRNHVVPRWDNERLVAHELSHQWFGNSLTAESWEDIWLHEGFACYSEWLWSEHSGRGTAQQQAAVHWQRLARSPQDLLVGSPGSSDMFDDRVYKRGALTVHAIRALLGDRDFFEMLRTWTTRHRHGVVTTMMFAHHVQAFTREPVAPLLDRWLYTEALSPLPQLEA
nr:M1 family metallopeptidase [Arsenicicoccus piscis]